MNFDNYLFRPHSLHRLMSGIPKPLTEKQIKLIEDYEKRESGEGRPLTNNQRDELGSLRIRRKEKCKLTPGAKSFLNELFDDFVSGIKMDLVSEKLDKGIRNEEEALTVISKAENILFLKNRIRVENEWLSGEYDTKKNGEVTDVKCKWSLREFKKLSTENSKAYEWQNRGYMNLTGLKNSRTVHVLTNTPSDILDKHLRKLDYSLNWMDLEGNIKEDFIPLLVEEVRRHIFSFKGLEEYCEESFVVQIDWFKDFVERPIEMRYKVIKTEFCKTADDQIKEIVRLSREYMNGILREELSEKSLKVNP